MPKSSSAERPLSARSVLLAILQVVLLYVALFIFVGDTRRVVSGSMEPTLRVGERVLVAKMPFPRTVFGVGIPGWRLPRHGEVVTFVATAVGPTLVKRVVGLPGDIVSMREGKLCVNSGPTAVNHTANPHFPVSDVNHWGPFRVPEGHLFVLGDNRQNSADSRIFGFLPIERLRGSVLAIYYSRDASGLRWDRMFHGAEEDPRMGPTGTGHLPWNEDATCEGTAATD